LRPWSVKLRRLFGPTFLSISFFFSRYTTCLPYLFLLNLFTVIMFFIRPRDSLFQTLISNCNILEAGRSNTLTTSLCFVKETSPYALTWTSSNSRDFQKAYLYKKDERVLSGHLQTNKYFTNFPASNAASLPASPPLPPPFCVCHFFTLHVQCTHTYTHTHTHTHTHNICQTSMQKKIILESKIISVLYRHNTILESKIISVLCRHKIIPEPKTSSVLCRHKIILQSKTSSVLCRHKIILQSKTTSVLCRHKIILQSKTTSLLCRHKIIPESKTSSVLCRHDKTAVFKLTCWVVQTPDYCTVRTLPGCCTWHKRGVLCRSLFRIPVAWTRCRDVREEDCRTDHSLWVAAKMKGCCGTPCSPVSCWVADDAYSNYHSDAERR
jgi:hypothetical protein